MRFLPSTIRHILLGCFVYLAFAMGPGNPCQAEAKPPRQSLLYLFSYQSSHATFPKQMRGLANVLEPAGIPFDIECLDLKRHDTPEHQQHLFDTLAYKLAHLPANYYAGVIVSDDKALLFALAHQETLFAGLPIVFFCVNNVDLARAQNDNNTVTGIIEAISWRNSIAVAKQLQPDLKTLYFIVENSWTGAATGQEIERLGKSYLDVALGLLDLHILTWSTMAEKLQSLQSGEAAVLLSFSTDAKGDPPQVVGGIETLYCQAAQPIYGAAELGVGRWTIGGHLFSHQLQAETAANMMLRILSGTPVTEIPVLEESPNRYIFDYNGLARFNIPLSRLPADATVINQPMTFMALHYSAVLELAGVLVALGALIATIYYLRQRHVQVMNRILTAEIDKRRETEETLLAYQSRLKALASEMALAEERQRRHIAGLLHDEVGQRLALTKMKLQCLQTQISSEDVHSELDNACETLTDTMNDLRSLSFELSSPILKELGLEKAVRHFLHDHVQGEHGLTVEYLDDGRPKPLEDDDREMLFRSIRELLINTIKHAQASHIRVEIKRLPTDLYVRVEDNGIGCDANHLNNPNVRSGYGLFSIRERLVQRGGILEFVSQPGHGCKATIKLPARWTA